MTQTKRIILNVAATYGRSFITLFMGLFSARWVLEALGQTDFGLYGVVGSVIFFVTFFNTVLSMSMTRFYSFSIGAGKNMKESDAHNDLKGWFNTALSIHICLPLILITIGYPICAYALDNWLVIPPERMQSCVWVLRMSFACAFVSMVSAPYVAMFTAYQYITELVVFNLLQNEDYHHELVDALNNYVDLGRIKFVIYNDKVYKSVFKENADEYRKILRLNKEDNERHTMYSEVLDLIASYEAGFADELKQEFMRLGRKLTQEETDGVYAHFEQQRLWVPLVNKARAKMASRDLCFRDALHANLTEYISAVPVEDFDRFIGDKSMELSQRLENYIEALKRLKERE